MRTIIYSHQIPTRNGTEAELLRAAVESRGDTVAATFSDDPTILGKGKYAGWRALVASVNQADQVVVGSAADLPGKSVADLLKILAALSDHGVSLVSSQDGIDTGSGSIAILNLITAYRAAKRSEAIKAGQARARAGGKRLGRPAVPERVRRRIADDLARGAGVRPTARKFKISPASVVNVRRSLTDSAEVLAA